MSKDSDIWSAPTSCLLCRYPLAEGSLVCSNCGAPQEPLSAGGAAIIIRQAGRTLVKLWEWSVILAASALGLYLCFKISPLLTLFPVLFVLSGPPER